MCEVRAAIQILGRAFTQICTIHLDITRQVKRTKRLF